MRRIYLIGAGLAVAFSAACQEHVAEPESTSEVATTNVVMKSVAPSAASLDRPAALEIPGGQLSDAELVKFAADAINPGDYVCPASTPVIDIYVNAFNQMVAEEFDIIFFLFVDVWADIIPQYEALVFLEEDRKDEYGYNGEFTNQMKRAIKDLRRFSDIPGDEIHVVPMKGTMLQDADRVARTYQLPFVPPFFGLTEAQAYFVAGLIQDALDASNLLDGGNHPLFSFNAFAFSGSVGLGIPPKIVMGDAIMNAFADLGLGDVAPQAILAHEWAHHIQFVKGYFDDPIPSLDPPATQAEATRYTELMADAWSAYYLTHKRGGAVNQRRVEQFLEVFFQIGDCAFTNPGHHGTPNQRMKAAQFGFDLADQAQKQGHIMSSEAFHDLFVAEYLNFIAPDA